MNEEQMIQNQATRIVFKTSELTIKTISSALTKAIDWYNSDHKGKNKLKKFVKLNPNIDSVEVKDLDISVMNRVAKRFNFKFAVEELSREENVSNFALYINSSPQRAHYVLQEYDKELTKDKIRKEAISKLFVKKDVSKTLENTLDKSIDKAKETIKNTLER